MSYGDKLLSAVISLSSPAMAIVKQYFQRPVIAGVSIEAQTYKENWTADSSTSLVMALNKGKAFVSDNIAPKPRSWLITGFIAPLVQEYSCLSPIIQPTLRIQKNKLKAAFDSRVLVPFITKDHEESLMVSITSCVLDSRAEIMNRIPISLTIQEVKMLQVELIDIGSIPVGSISLGTQVAVPQ
jgi:hypothetical protein